MIKKVLIYTVILLVIIIISRIISNIYIPVIKDTTQKYDSFIDYMTAVYCPNNKCGNYLPYPVELIIYKDDYNSLSSLIEENKDKHIHESQINIMNTLRYFNYIYDDAPRLILDNYPLADNLSFSWPPKMGSRYKLTAFPYPKSTFILSAVYETISNTIDAYTFPGWMIQRRNPLDFNNSIYNNNYFKNNQDVEVVHACYPPPGYSYPYCDDGGYWLYLATGSGVFWNTGKCIVSLNKLSLLNDLYNYSFKIRKDVAILNEIKKKKILLPPVLGLSIQDIVDRLQGKGGGYSIMVAIFTVVKSLTEKNKKSIPKMIGFKNMTPSNKGKSVWDNFISRTFLILYLMAVTIIQLFVNIRNKNYEYVILIILICLILLATLIYIFLFYIFENFFRDLGWMTLDMALKDTNMTLYQFVEECVTGQLKNPICNSLAMTQLFDLDIEIYSYAMKYDSFILTSQPNKTGNWEVEICDLRNFDKDNLITKGGVCGHYQEHHSSIQENELLQKTKHILKSGPISFDPIGRPPFYKPNNNCDCKEGKDKLCINCNGYLSEKLCINK